MPRYKVTLEGIAFGDTSIVSIGVEASDETDAEDRATVIARSHYGLRDALVIMIEERIG